MTPVVGLDPSFGLGGLASLSLDAARTLTASVGQVQPDGKIVAAGRLENTLVVYRTLPDGTLDASFSGDGYAPIPLADPNAFLTGITVQGDGKIVLAGYGTGPNANVDFLVARVNTDGSMDAGFGTGGVQFVTFDLSGDLSDQAEDVTIAPDDGIIVVGRAGVNPEGLASTFALAKLTSTGALDNTFDTDGKLTLTFPGQGSLNSAQAVDIDPVTGQIVVAGTVQLASFDIGVARLSQTGVLDATFDGDGLKTIAFDLGGSNRDFAADVLVRPDRRIVVGGTAQLTNDIGTGNSDFAIAQLTVTGALDNTFSGDGKATVAFDLGGNLGDSIESMALRGNGSLVLAGAAISATGNFDFAIAQLTSDGALDPDFGNLVSRPGRSTVAFDVGGANNDDLNAMGIQADTGRIITIGSVIGQGDALTAAIAALDLDGQLDSSFDDDGKRLLLLGQSIGQVGSTALQADGKLVMVGTRDFNPSTWISITRMNADGTLDTSFGFSGFNFILFNEGVDERNTGRAVAIDPVSGKILVAASVATAASGANTSMGLARVNTDGTIDTSFGTDGLLVLPFDLGGNNADDPFAILVQPDQSILVAGSIQTASGPLFAMAKVTSGGTLDLTYGGGDGYVTVPAAGFGYGQIRAIARQANGSVVAVGPVAATAGGAPDFGVARFTSAGVLDNTFDTDGLVVVPFDQGGGTKNDTARGVAIDGSGNIVVAGYAAQTNGTDFDFAVARLTSTGALDNTFDTDGKVTVSVIGGGAQSATRASAVALQGNQILVLGTADRGGAAGTDFALLRLNSNGSPDTTFAAGGQSVAFIGFNFGGGNADAGLTLALRSTGEIVAAGSAASNVPTGATLGGVAQLVEDDTIPTITSITNLLPDDPNPRTSPLASLDVQFSEELDLSSFTIDALALTRDSAPVPLTNAVLIAHLGGGLYRISGLENFTNVTGVYQLTVDATQVTDLPGNAGMGSESVDFEVDVSPPVIVQVGPVAPDPRNVPVDSIDITFDQPIVPASFTLADLTLTRNLVNVPLAAPVAITQLSPTTFRVTNLTNLTNVEGVYELTVIATGVVDFAGNAGTGTAAESFAVLLSGPLVTGIESVTPDPRNTPVNTIDVVFSQPINTATFTFADMTITRNGINVPLAGAPTVTLVNGTTSTYRVSGLAPFTGETGNYLVTVNGAGIQNGLGTSGTGSPSVVFNVDSTPPTIVAIQGVPDTSQKASRYPINNALTVVFSEAIAAGTNLTRANLTLLRNGANVPLTDAVTVTRLSANSFQISGLTAATRLSGDYELRIDPSGVTDLIGNPGSGVGTATFEINRGVLLGDYDGDGIIDRATYIYNAATGSGRFDVAYSSNGEIFTQSLGVQGAIPVAGDFDGDGKTDVAVYNPLGTYFVNGLPFTGGVWTWIRSSDRQEVEFAFGGAGVLDRPAPGDYDGDGITDLGVFRANSDLNPGEAQWFIRPSRDINAAFTVRFGAANGVDLPATGDYDGDFVDDIATFRPIPTTQDLAGPDGPARAGNAQWFIIRSSVNVDPSAPLVPGVPLYQPQPPGAFLTIFGGASNLDQPAPADYDGDAFADVTAFRSTSDLTAGVADWFVLRSSSNGQRYTFGTSGDIGAPGDYTGDGIPDLAVFTPATRAWSISPAAFPLNPVQSTFGPPGNAPTAVPVLAPLFFRLLATGNPTSASGGPSFNAMQLAGSTQAPAPSAGQAGYASNLGGLIGAAMAGSTSSGSSSPGDSDDAGDDLFDRALDDLGNGL